MIRYIHGSKDSLDLDVFYVFEKMPSFQESQEFCASKEENRNIIVIENGRVTDCYKGTIDEINNGLVATYPLHSQKFDLLVTQLLERDVLIKTVRVVRCLLSHLSRTTHRPLIKETHKSSSWKKRMDTLQSIDFTSITDFGLKGNKQDIYKVFAFQLGQVMGLFEEIEFYTKSSVAGYFPDLKPYLYRENDPDLKPLQAMISLFLEKINTFSYTEENDTVHFPDFNRKIKLKNEEYIH